MDNYKLIEEVRERAVSRADGYIEILPSDVVAKIEFREGSEHEYFNGFRDYHGPK